MKTILLSTLLVLSVSKAHGEVFVDIYPGLSCQAELRQDIEIKNWLYRFGFMGRLTDRNDFGESRVACPLPLIGPRLPEYLELGVITIQLGVPSTFGFSPSVDSVLLCGVELNRISGCIDTQISRQVSGPGSANTTMQFLFTRQQIEELLDQAVSRILTFSIEVEFRGDISIINYIARWSSSPGD